MHFHKSYKIGPSKTPLTIKIIIGAIISLSIINALTAPVFKAQYLSYFLGLTINGFKSFYLWQFVTYPLLQPTNGISVGFLIELAFNCYLIWIIGAMVLERLSLLQYLIFCFLSTVFSAAVMLCIMAAGLSPMIYAGPAILLYANLIAWMMLNPPDAKIFLFYALPLKHYWLVLGLIGFNLFTNLSNGQIVNAFGYTAVSVFSYFYSVIFWERLSPFHHFHKMERSLMHFSRPILEKFKRRKLH